MVFEFVRPHLTLSECDQVHFDLVRLNGHLLHATLIALVHDGNDEVHEDDIAKEDCDEPDSPHEEFVVAHGREVSKHEVSNARSEGYHDLVEAPGEAVTFGVIQLWIS